MFYKELKIKNNCINRVLFSANTTRQKLAQRRLRFEYIFIGDIMKMHVDREMTLG